MKYILCILCCILLVGCKDNQSDQGVIEIIGTRNGMEIVRGMGVCIDDSIILTSAHVVRDDSVNYELRMSNYDGEYINSTLIERDIETDIAYMKIMNNEGGMIHYRCSNPKSYIGKTELKIGENISIPVFRSGAITTLTGTITSLTGTVLAYDTLGRTQLLSGVLMTDISLQPGDSGAPVLDEEGRVIDVVHLK